MSLKGPAPSILPPLSKLAEGDRGRGDSCVQAVMRWRWGPAKGGACICHCASATCGCRCSTYGRRMRQLCAAELKPLLPSPACKAPALSGWALCPQSRPPRSCSICVCSWLGRSRSHCHSRNPQSESHRVSVQTTHEWPSPSPPVRGRGRLHGWGLCFSCISAALLFPRLDHHRGPSLPHDAPLLEPYPARQHQVGLSEGVCVCLCTGWLTTATPPPPTFTRMHSVCQRTPGASLLESGDAIALGTPTPGRVQCSGTQPGSPCQPAWMEPCEPGHTTCLSLGSHFCGWEESRACPRLSGPCWLRRLPQKAGRGGLMGPGGRSRLASGTAGRRDSRCRLDLVSLPLASVLLCRLMSRKALHGGTVGSCSVTPTWV